MSFEELTNNHDFMRKLDETKSYEEAKELFAAEGVDLDAELESNQSVELPADVELSEEELEGVAGGITWGQIKKAWKIGLQAGVVIRNLWDAAHGKPLSYPKWKFQW